MHSVGCITFHAHGLRMKPSIYLRESMLAGAKFSCTSYACNPHPHLSFVCRAGAAVPCKHAGPGDAGNCRPGAALRPPGICSQGARHACVPYQRPRTRRRILQEILERRTQEQGCKWCAESSPTVSGSHLHPTMETRCPAQELKPPVGRSRALAQSGTAGVTFDGFGKPCLPLLLHCKTQCHSPLPAPFQGLAGRSLARGSCLACYNKLRNSSTNLISGAQASDCPQGSTT